MHIIYGIRVFKNFKIMFVNEMLLIILYYHWGSDLYVLKKPKYVNINVITNCFICDKKIKIWNIKNLQNNITKKKLLQMTKNENKKINTIELKLLWNWT